MAETQSPLSRRGDSFDGHAPNLAIKNDCVHDHVVAMNPNHVHGDAVHGHFAGGFDDTPIPHAPLGHTLKFTFHRGINLPCADFGSFSSDPYIAAQLVVNLPQRHREDPKVTFRTPTVRKDTDPVWNCEWIVANIPVSGFELRCSLYDEDPADHDDKLGHANVGASEIDDHWQGFSQASFKVKKRMASKRVYLFGNLSSFASRRQDTSSYLVISVEHLGRTPGAEGGQMYTVGPNYWFKHFSPLIGRLAGTKDEVQNDSGEKGAARYNFQAIQIQLRGPVPSQLYHRYVEFRPFVAGMFTSQSLKGWVLNRALHHQHGRVYNFDRTTVSGAFSSPCVELTQKFLEFVHYGQGGRIFTYVLTLDGQLRFTETGKEFGIDLLSKHTMHSNVSIYIAYSGEFFVRRRKKHHHRQNHGAQCSEGHGRPSSTEIPTELSTDPADYELFIDNDSGTYRPNAQYLHLLKVFISANLPGLHVTTLDCQADAEVMQDMKDEQREFKKTEGLQMTFLQQSSSSSLSISSSDEEELDERSGLSQKKRGEFSRRAHDMRDVKGHVMKWAQADAHPDSHGQHANANGAGLN